MNYDEEVRLLNYIINLLIKYNYDLYKHKIVVQSLYFLDQLK